MLNKERAGDIFDRVRKYSTADEVEVLFYGGKSALTRFANNTIHQNVAEENYGVSVRTAFDGRTARATTNKFDNESLKRVVQASEALAKVQQPDSDLLPMPNAGEGARATQSLPSRHFEQTAAVTPEQRAHSVSKIVSIATNHKLTAAGIFSSSESAEGIFNSRGLSEWHTQTSSEISITMLAADSSGWQKTNSPDVANLNAQALVENGVVKRLVYARATAEKMRSSEYKDKVGIIEPTGHGFPIPNEMGEAPMNIVFAAPKDSKTIDQMVASTEHGVLVTRLWYIREVDPYEKILTGMTRDGTFYVQDGKIRHGIRNFRFNESLIHMLSNVEEMGTPVRASGEESFDMVVPAMKVKEFNFTEVTKF